MKKINLIFAITSLTVAAGALLYTPSSESDSVQTRTQSRIEPMPQLEPVIQQQEITPPKDLVTQTLTLTQSINQVESGAMVFEFETHDSMTNLALETMATMDINGVFNRVSVKQTFINPSNDWAEGTYVFPLPENAAVDQLRMIIGDRIIEGEIHEKKAARKIYQTALASGQKASLVEAQRPNIFTSKIANIGPGEEVSIEISYLQNVKIEGEDYSIRFPMTVGERFINGHAIATPDHAMGTQLNTHKVIDASEITPPNDRKVERPVHLTINLAAGFEIEQIDTPYHHTNIQTISKQTRTLTLNTQAERDFVLNWKRKAGQQSQMSLFKQSLNGEHFLMVMATPPNDEAVVMNRIPKEVIYIIDSSGSMSGTSMKQAKSALKQSLAALSSKDRFNIIDFDDQFQPMFREALPAVNLNKKRAVHFIERMEADGGTEPNEAIEFALQSRDSKSSKYLRQIVFLTDGQVGNEAELFRTLNNLKESERFFTIAIGSAPNEYLMKQLAQIGQGFTTFIGSERQVELEMQKALIKMDATALTNMQLHLPENLESNFATPKLPDLLSGQTLTSVIKVSHLPKELALTAKHVDKSLSMTFDMAQAIEAKGLAEFWAKTKIDALLNLYHLEYNSSKKDSLKQSIIRLALKYHLVTPFTSLVAVEKVVSRPESEALNQQALASRVKAPKTATVSQLWLLIGFFVMVMAMFMQLKTKWRGQHVE